MLKNNQSVATRPDICCSVGHQKINTTLGKQHDDIPFSAKMKDWRQMEGLLEAEAAPAATTKPGSSKPTES